MTNLYFSLSLSLLVTAVIFDLRSREIPDWISIAMTGLACMAAAFSWADVRWWMVGSGAALGLLVSVVLFYVSNFGGGDAKLIIGLGALLGPVALWIVLFWMALAGGVLALIALARGHRDYAYAPAIAAGFIGYLVSVSIY